MITTNDIKIKDQEPKKLTIISSGDVKPKQFVIKDKSKSRDKRIITTSNVDEFKHTPRKSKPKKEEIIEPMETITHPIAKDIKVGETTTGEYEIKVEKKPWKEMTIEEKAIEMKRRTAKAKETKARKKKEALTGTRDSGRDE